jgi:hypothetical protein
VLAQVPFVSGYGVETAMLIDLLELVGLDALAQVDLGERKHRHQDTAALGRMSAQIMLTAWSRLQRRGWASPGTMPAALLTQFRRGGSEALPNLDREIVVSDVSIEERPPLAELRHRAPATGGGGVSHRWSVGPERPVVGRGRAASGRPTGAPPKRTPRDSLTVLMNAGPLSVPPGLADRERHRHARARAARLGVRVVMASVGTSTLPVDERISVFDDGQFHALQRPYNQVCGIAQAHLAGVVRALRSRDDIDLVHDHVEAVGLATLAAMGPDAPPAHAH